MHLVILCFSIVGVFTDKWHNKDYLSSVGTSQETLSDRPGIDYSIITVALLGFLLEIIHIFIQIATSIFCSKKKQNLAKVAPEPKPKETILNPDVQGDFAIPLHQLGDGVEGIRSKENTNDEELHVLEAKSPGSKLHPDSQEEPDKHVAEDNSVEPILLQRSVTTKAVTRGTWTRSKTNTRLD